jgi:hypothetical protein
VTRPGGVFHRPAGRKSRGAILNPNQAMTEANMIFALLVFAFAIRFAWLELSGN